MHFEYQKLARLLENELEALRQVSNFYGLLAAGLKQGTLPAIPELLAAGARAQDDLKRVGRDKREFLAAAGVAALRDLLHPDYPAAVRRLVGRAGSEMVGLRRQIEEWSRAIRRALEVSQLINRRLLGFFEQLCPAVISYQDRGRMMGRPLYSGYAINSSF
ncbi:MAG: hypothetical protein JXR89_02060 [Deltaproteobacteria bacterium]|nr:hypothetical protein [Deltaproteobacteria bacterium]